MDDPLLTLGLVAEAVAEVLAVEVGRGHALIDSLVGRDLVALLKQLDELLPDAVLLRTVDAAAGLLEREDQGVWLGLAPLPVLGDRLGILIPSRLGPGHVRVVGAERDIVVEDPLPHVVLLLGDKAALKQAHASACVHRIDKPADLLQRLPLGHLLEPAQFSLRLLVGQVRDRPFLGVDLVGPRLLVLGLQQGRATNLGVGLPFDELTQARRFLAEPLSLTTAHCQGAVGLLRVPCNQVVIDQIDAQILIDHDADDRLLVLIGQVLMLRTEPARVALHHGHSALVANDLHAVECQVVLEVLSAAQAVRPVGLEALEARHLGQIEAIHRLHRATPARAQHDVRAAGVEGAPVVDALDLVGREGDVARSLLVTLGLVHIDDPVVPSVLQVLTDDLHVPDVYLASLGLLPVVAVKAVKLIDDVLNYVEGNRLERLDHALADRSAVIRFRPRVSTGPRRGIIGRKVA